jgi:glycosyltransferase involved in cell wall biosynthesis
LELEYTTILAVKNGEVFLQTALDSIRNQTYLAHQIILVDDDSNDRTVAIAQSNGVEVLRNRGIGQAAALNTVIDSCETRFVAFLDHDDYWALDKQEKQMSYFHNIEMPDYVVSQVINQDSFGNTKNMGASRVLGACTFTLDFLKMIGPFNEELKHHAIVEWWGRQDLQSTNSVEIQEPLFFRLIHGENTTMKSKDEAQKSLLEAVRTSLSNKK